MPIKIQVAAPGGIMLELVCENNHDVFKQLSFWSSLPHECPIDGYPTRLNYKTPGDNEYFEVVSTGPIPWSKHIGQRKNATKDLFHSTGDKVWAYWDYEQNREVQAREGDAQQPRPKPASVAESATPDIRGQDNEVLMSGADIDAAAEEEFPPDFPDDLLDDDAMTQALVAVADKLGYTREQVDKVAKKAYGVKHLNDLELPQMVEIQNRMKKKAGA